MIKKIRLQGFKCFSDNIFPLKPLTVLSGRNASGKTSFLHALALLHQTACEGENFDKLMLNGPVVHLGRAEDVLNKTHARNTVDFELDKDSTVWQRDYTVPDQKPGTASPDRQSFFFQKNGPGRGQDSEIYQLFRNLTYLSADRLGPKETHSLDDSIKYHDVGTHGERTISALLRQGEYHVIDELCYPETAPLLLKQVQAYMNDIFPGFRMDIQPIIGTNNATLQFATNAAVGFVRPQNIGFGLSFTLPIYTACLCAGKGDIVMVENPEAHLHPFAQSQIGDFIAKTASAGVQVIVETHSDHVLNGIRKSVKNEAHPIKASDTAVYFFSGLKEEGDPMIISTEIKDDGSLTEWPDGFFNQYEKDLAELVEW